VPVPLAATVTSFAVLLRLLWAAPLPALGAGQRLTAPSEPSPWTIPTLVRPSHPRRVSR